MRQKTFAYALVLIVTFLLCGTPGWAQIDAQTEIPVVFSADAACGAAGGPGDRKLKILIDATSSIDCDTTGEADPGDYVAALCICDAGTLHAANLVADTEDLAAYVLITLAGQQSITASGAGNDVTLVAADDVLITPGDDFVVTPTAGGATLNAVGAGEDVALVAADDVLLTPTDALTAAVGGAATITTTAGAITLTAGGTTQDISLISVDQVIIDGAGGADELVVDNDSVAVGAAAAFYVAIAAAPPVACAAGTKGALYYDSDINKICICNATNYVLINDDATTTGCS